MADKPIVVTVPSLRGAEYGYPDIETAQRIFPDAVPVRYQDGTPLEESTADESKPVSKMNRDELEAHAITLGIENPSEYANVGELRAAIVEVDNA